MRALKNPGGAVGDVKFLRRVNALACGTLETFGFEVLGDVYGCFKLLVASTNPLDFPT